MFNVSPYVIWIMIDNIQCDGEDLLDQAERCHYSSDFRHDCAAPISDEYPIVPITNDTPAIICTCKFRDGQRVCADCK